MNDHFTVGLATVTFVTSRMLPHAAGGLDTIAAGFVALSQALSSPEQAGRMLEASQVYQRLVRALDAMPLEPGAKDRALAALEKSFMHVLHGIEAYQEHVELEK